MTIPRWETVALSAVLSYETVGLLTRNNRRVPTLTYLQSRYHPLGYAMVAFLALHFVDYDRKVTR